MSGIYAALLDRIAAQPSLVYGGRLSLPVRQKAADRGQGPLGAGPVTRVGVVGGGLAGITAALDLAAAGREVELLRVAALARRAGLVRSAAAS
jgi:NADPH-dependent glutamate synthase beta subunit-like oxidoreductase